MELVVPRGGGGGGVWLLQGSRARVLGFSILGGFTGVQHSQAGLLEGRRRSPEALHGETESDAHASPKLLNRWIVWFPVRYSACKWGKVSYLD